MRKASPYLVLLLLATTAFSLATILQLRVDGWSRRGEPAGVLGVLLGDGRRLFANHFFVQADVAFHSGYYPSILDQVQAPKDSRHMTAAGSSAVEQEHEKKMNFLGPPRDWIERFGRHFMVTSHTHLKEGMEGEMLPWLRLSAELDPQRIDTYTVAAFWLHTRLGKVKEAEQFLREGLRANPDSYEILFELGRIYQDKYHDPNRARNVWELALRRWRERQSQQKEPDTFGLEQITINLARLEELAGNLSQAIDYLEMTRKVSPHPAALQQQIDELKQKLGSPAAPPPPHQP